MGRNAKHTQDQVFDVADAMAAEGVEVTPTQLRERLGGGSYGTICDHLSAWRTARAAKPAPLVIEMPEAARGAFNAVWAAVSAEAGKLVAEARDQAAAEVARAAQALTDARANIDRLEMEADQDASSIEALRSDLESSQREATAAGTAAAEKVASLEATVVQLQKQMQQMGDDLRSEVDKARREAAASSHEAGAAVQEKGQALEALAECKKELAGALTRERGLIGEVAATKAAVERLEGQLKDQRITSGQVVTQLEESKRVLEADLTAARNEVRALGAAQARGEGELEALRTRVAEQSDLLKKLTPARAARTKAQGDGTEPRGNGGAKGPR